MYIGNSDMWMWEKDKEEKTVPLTIYEQLKVTEESLPDEETKVIQKVSIVGQKHFWR